MKSRRFIKPPTLFAQGRISNWWGSVSGNLGGEHSFAEHRDHLNVASSIRTLVCDADHTRVAAMSVRNLP
jgi:hypothetical protein